LFIVDQSYATNECADPSGSGFVGGDPRCMTGANRWTVLSQAVTAFMQDPATAGLDIALRFFPSDKPVAGCDGYATTGSGFGGAAGTSAGGAAGMINCSTDACAAPLIEPARLTADAAPTDTQEAALVAAIDAAGPYDAATQPTPNPQAPTSAALSGAAQWATAYQAAHPDERTAIVLVTHGQPQGCDVNVTDIVQLAADAYMQSAVRTFVVGLSGLNSNFLDDIAKAGGTHQALYVPTSGGSFTQDLLTQLNAP
jgi:hypothetical protein